MLSSHRLRLSETLQQVILLAEQEMNNRDDACKALKEKLKELQKTAEPVPERSADRIAAREILTKHDISYRSFYECIDFKESIPEPQRVVLEAELAEETQSVLSQFEIQVQLDVDGCYQYGIMAGHSLGQTHVLYIGAENRRLF